MAKWTAEQESKAAACPLASSQVGESVQVYAFEREGPKGMKPWALSVPRHFNWVSLSNIAFAPGTVGHITLPLHNG